MPENKLHPEQIWEAARGEMRLLLGAATYEAWLREIVWLGYDADTNVFRLGVRDPETQRWLEKRLLSTIERTLTAIQGFPGGVRVQFLSPGPDSQPEKVAESISEPDIFDWVPFGIPHKFIAATLESVDWSQPALQKPELRDYVTHAPAHFQAGVGLNLIGSPGTGKTHIAVGLLKQAINARLSGYFTGTSALLDALRATFEPAHQSSLSSSERAILCKLTRVRLLVLDDLRVDSLTSWGRDRLYAILNPRWERSLPTITTSNYTPGELARPVGRDRPGLDDGTLSRLVRTALTIQLEGADYRLTQKQETLATLRNPDRRRAPGNSELNLPPPRIGETDD